MDLKRVASEKAVQYVQSGMILGLGTGSTVQHVLELLGERLHRGVISNIVGVPTSEATTQQAIRLGIPLTTLEDHPQLDLTIDGADEVSPDLNLIKGLGGALLREKIVATASKQLLIVADATKQVKCLGSRSPLPVEVIPFGWTAHVSILQRLGAEPQLRRGQDGHLYHTDNGNLILDCSFPDGIQDANGVARALESQPGVVEHGLFLDMATVVCIGTSDGVVVLTRESA